MKNIADRVISPFAVTSPLLSILFVALLFPATLCASNASFDQVWHDFDQHYSYFVYKNIDWDAVREEYEFFFTEDMTADELLFWLNEMLSELHDWHVWLRSADGEYSGYSESYAINYPEQPYARYAANGAYQQLGDGVIEHGIVDDNIAYIAVNTLSSSAFTDISDERIEELFQLYAATDGMIIDIRANNGGNEYYAAAFASHFTDQERVYGYVRYRTPGDDHQSFGAPITKTLTPSTANRYDKPVVCLIGKKCMSSAEWFTLMMRNCPNVTLIGDQTRGASGNPSEFTLTNGISYSVSTWVAYTEQMSEFEDKGITPDIMVAAEQSFDNERDYVLEKAIEVIRQGASSTEEQITIAGCAISGAQTANNPVSMSVQAQSAAGTPLFYRFSQHPDYGTSAYDNQHWNSMTASEYVGSNAVSATYAVPNKHIVVAWVVDDPSEVDPSGVPIIGWSIDTSDNACKTTISGAQLSGAQTVNSPITMSVSAVNQCGWPLFYRFSMHPDYGTAGYDNQHWSSMTSSEYISANSLTHAFASAGKYIVVVWVVSDPDNVTTSEVPIIGFSVDIR